MTIVEPTRWAPATTRVAVRVQDLTGLKEDVLYAVGYAERVGALVRVVPVADHGNGSVTVRVHHTLLVPLALPRGLAAVRLGAYRDGMDYVELGLLALPWVAGGGVVAALGWAVYEVYEWFHQHAAVIATGVSVLLGAGLVALLLMLCGGARGGCAGLHCGGCRG